MSEHCAGALHVCLEQLCSSDKAGLLCRRKTRCLGFGTGCGTAADTRQILGSSEHEHLVTHLQTV